jgi:hypothetical protein
MTCDRACLSDVVDQYLAGLAARDPSRVPAAPGIRYTENCQALELGSGLWATATGLGPYRLEMADAGAGQVGVFATVEEMGNLAVLALRLAVRDRRVAEAEALVARLGNPIFSPESLARPRPELTRAVPEGARCSREELIAIANLYFDGIERNDGGIIPVTEECLRLENGVQTTLNPERQSPVGRMRVAEAISTGIYAYIPRIRDRRYPVVDEERGLVLGIVFFEHPGSLKTVEVAGVGTVELPPFTQKPTSAMIAEVFKVEDRRITQIEAVLEFLPYGIRSGW